MAAELKQSANAVFADCDELPAGTALLALEASRYLHEATGWPSIEGLCRACNARSAGVVPRVRCLPLRSAKSQLRCCLRCGTEYRA